MKKINDFKLLVLGFLLLGACTGKKTGPDPSTVRLAIKADARNFDPVFTEDYYTNEAVGMVYEGLLEYDYLKRPHEVRPLLAESMPEKSHDELTYTFKLKKGVHFADDAAFEGGKGREVKARDFVYSFLRLCDPKVNASGFWVFDGHVAGLAEWREKQKAAAKTDYETVFEGIKALDEYTLQIKLKQKYPQLLYILAMPQTMVVAKEAVEKYGKEFVNKPVGTGPYKLVGWTRNTKINFDKNPTWHGETYPTDGSTGDKEKGLLNDAGKPLPFVDHVELQVSPEEQPRWLSFMSGASDVMELPYDYVTNAIDPKTGKLKPELEKKGITIHAQGDVDVFYIGFNMEDPVIAKGGPNLRKAIAMAIDTAKDNELFFYNQGLVAQSPLPSGIAGYDPNYVNPSKTYNIEKAKELLAKAGYPGGKGLPSLTLEIIQGTMYRQLAEKYQKELAAIGIDLKVSVNQFSELVSKQNQRKAQMWELGWIADYPDAENFLQLLYGPNSSPGPNNANYNNSQYNKLFEKVREMADSPARRKMIRQMQDNLAESMPWVPVIHRVQFYLVQPWLKNFKVGYMGPFLPAKFYRIEAQGK